MRRAIILLAVVVPVASLASCGKAQRPSLSIGDAAPAFALPGIDGRTHTLADYAAQPVLAVVFTCNHCPESQRYERRLERMYEDYRDKGVALVAISPNDPDAMAPGDLKHSDVGDDLDGMKTRAEFRHLQYPYLFGGASPAIAEAFGVVAMPEIFVFGRDRTLRYAGRIDDSPEESLARTHEARDAIDALLAGRPVAVARTTVTGCPPVRRDGAGATLPGSAGGGAAAVSLEMAGPDLLKTIRGNGTHKYLLVNFWATWCGPCAVEFPDLVQTYRMYRDRPFDFVSISVNQPEERPLVLAFLSRHGASNRNLLFATPDTSGLQVAFDPAMPAAVPFTLLIAPNGDVLYQELGSLDIMKMRRAILASLPEDGASLGLRTYWSAD